MLSGSAAKCFVLTGLLISMAPASADAATGTGSCPAFENGPTSEVEADRVYTALAWDILRAGMSADSANLAQLVSPDAEFSIFRGDYSTSARAKGPAGAIEMVADMDVVSYQTLLTPRGPIAVMPSECVWTATLLLRTHDDGRGIIMRFKFIDGHLIHARGDEVEILEGNLTQTE